MGEIKFKMSDMGVGSGRQQNVAVLEFVDMPKTLNFKVTLDDASSAKWITDIKKELTADGARIIFTTLPTESEYGRMATMTVTYGRLGDHTAINIWQKSSTYKMPVCTPMDEDKDGFVYPNTKDGITNQGQPFEPKVDRQNYVFKDYKGEDHREPVSIEIVENAEMFRGKGIVYDTDNVAKCVIGVNPRTGSGGRTGLFNVKSLFNGVLEQYSISQFNGNDRLYAVNDIDLNGITLSANAQAVSNTNYFIFSTNINGGIISLSADVDWITDLVSDKTSIFALHYFSFKHNVTANDTGANRTGHITVTVTPPSGNAKNLIIKVTQTTVKIDFPHQSLEYAATDTSGENTLSMTGTTALPTFTSDSEWLTAGGYDAGNGSLSFSMTENDTARDRTGTITANVTEDGHTYTNSFTVTQRDKYGNSMEWVEKSLEFNGTAEERHGTLIFHGSYMPKPNGYGFAFPTWLKIENINLNDNGYTVDVPMTAEMNLGDTRNGDVKARYTDGKIEWNSTLPVTQTQMDLRYLEWRENPMYFDFKRNGGSNVLAFDGWDEVPLGTQFTTDSEWIHLGYFDHDTNEMPFTITMNETDTSRTGNVKASYTDTDGKTFEDTFMIVQGAFVIEHVPVWKDETVTYDVESSDSFMDYKIYDGDTMIYEGRAFPRPNENTVSICPNRVVENYLQQNVDFDSYKTVQDNDDAVKTIRLETASGNIYRYYAVYDWSYDMQETAFDGDRSAPVRKTIDTRMFAPKTTITNGKCTTRWDSDGYEKKSMCGDYYGIYYVNDKGGWDAFLFKGRNTRTDNITRNNVERSVSNLSRQHRNSVYVSEVTTKWNLYTDYLSNDECSRMYQIFESPLVYLHDLAADEIVPVNVTSTSVEYKDTIWNRKRYYSVEFTRSRTLYRK